MKTTKLILTTLILLGLSSCSIFKKANHIITDCNPYAIDAARYTDSSIKYFDIYQQAKDPGSLVKSIIYGDSSALSITGFINCSKDTSAVSTAKIALSSSTEITSMQRVMYTSRFGRTIAKPKELKK